METGAVLDLILYLVVAIVVYALLVQFLFWQVPRRRHKIPGTVVSFAGALLGAVVVKTLWPNTPLFGELVAAGLVAVGFVYAAVKVGTPGSVVLTIDTAIDSGHKDEFRREEIEFPFVWPYYLAVEKYGTVIWELRGAEGTVVTIKFPENNTPFGKDGQGQPRSRFEGTVPGRIVASPTIRAGRGSYTIEAKTRDGEEIVGDPGWGIPSRKD